MNSIITNYIEQELLNNKGNIKIEQDEDLLTTGILDSMSIMKLIQYIEKFYGFTIPPEDMTIENFISVDAMEEYLNARKTA
jgi:acyl carrier protein